MAPLEEIKQTSKMHYTQQPRGLNSAVNRNYTKRPFQALLNRYCRLVHAPNVKERLNADKLNALRVAAAWRAIFQRPSIAPALAVMAQIPMKNIPFAFTDLDAFRMQVDALHARSGK